MICEIYEPSLKGAPDCLEWAWSGDSSGVFPVSTQGEGVAEHFSGSDNKPGELVRSFFNCHYLVSLNTFKI